MKNTDSEIETKLNLFKQEVPVEKIEAINKLNQTIIENESQALTHNLDQAALVTDLKAETKHGQWKRTVETRLELGYKTVERLLKLHKHREALLVEMAKNDTTVSNLTSAYRFCNKLARELKAAKKMADLAATEEVLDQVLPENEQSLDVTAATATTTAQTDQVVAAEATTEVEEADQVAETEIEVQEVE